jgi:molybdenum cofactor biosynthesis protein B
MSESVAEHRSTSPKALKIAVITVSDSRTIETDTSGALAESLAVSAGHEVIERVIVRDEPGEMQPLLERIRDEGKLHAAIMTGGTGVSRRDQTYETVSTLLTKPLPGYGELFRMLSYEQIGPAAILSRAVGGLMGELVVLVMPGSRAAVELAMTKIVLPELPHLVRESRK